MTPPPQTPPPRSETPPRDDRIRRNGRSPQFRRLIPYAAGIALLVAIGLGLRPKPVPVELTKVTRGPLQATVNEEGRTRIRQRYVIAAPVAGNLHRIPHKPGATVVAGQTVLATLDPLPPALLDARHQRLAEARRDTARANLEKAVSALGFAASELRRAEKLFADRTISTQQLEEAQWRQTAATKELAAAESALREAEAELAQFIQPPAPTQPQDPPTTVVAPVSGRVLRVFEESARAVTQGTPLLEIGDPTDLEVVIEVLSRDGAAIAPGTRVLLEHWGGPNPLEARARLVEPAAFTKISALGVEEQRVNVVADIVSPQSEWTGLGDGFRVEARILVWETNSTLKVRTGALFRQGTQWATLAHVAGRAQLRLLQTGRGNDREIQVTEGLQEGDEVILYPGDRVKAGDRVTRLQVSD